MVLEVHGSDIQPFGYDDRVDFLVALDNAIVHINLSNIELLAVEEFLPAAGPAAESLLNLYGTNGIIGKPPLKPQAEAPGNPAAQTLSGNPAGPPQTRAAGRKLLQIPPRGTYSGACNLGAMPLPNVVGDIEAQQLSQLHLSAAAGRRLAVFARCALQGCHLGSLDARASLVTTKCALTIQVCHARLPPMRAG